MSGISKTRLYNIFSGMKQRCYNQKLENYKYYGGKGIKVCDEWSGKEGCQAFIEWSLNNGYNDDLTIDRIDSNGNYSPENCRWITLSENCKRALKSRKSEIIYNYSPGVKFYKLFKILDEQGLTMYDLRKNHIVGTATLEKMRKGEGNIDTRTIEKLCAYLSCQPGDLMEYIPDGEKPQA